MDIKGEEGWKVLGDRYIYTTDMMYKIDRASPVAQMVNKHTCSAGDLGSIPGLGRSPGEGNWLPIPVFIDRLYFLGLQNH